jgi:hypothetical protein
MSTQSKPYSTVLLKALRYRNDGFEVMLPDAPVDQLSKHELRSVHNEMKTPIPRARRQVPRNHFKRGSIVSSQTFYNYVHMA